MEGYCDATASYLRRERRIDIVRRRLVRRSRPRFHVTLILSLTTLAGFLTSVVLLHSGVSWMWLRYPLAISLAYGVFLFLLGMWLSLHRDTPYIEFPDIDLGNVDFSSHTATGYADT